jgi:hypothetical protein
LYLVITLPTSTPIFPALLGGGQQLLPGAGAVGGQDRVAAGDEPLAGEVSGGDLREVLLVEEAELQRPVVGHELPDPRP